MNGAGGRKEKTFITIENQCSPGPFTEMLHNHVLTFEEIRGGEGEREGEKKEGDVGGEVEKRKMCREKRWKLEKSKVGEVES